MPKQRMLFLVEALQSIHQVTNQLIEGHYPKHNQLKVIAFETVEDFVAEFQTDQYIGFMQPAMRQHVLAFGLADHTLDPYNVAFHEYTHFVSRSRYEYFVPLWYEEGFAQYIGNATLKDNSVTLGDIRQRSLIRALRRNDHKWRTILDGVPRLDWHEDDYEEHYEFAHAIVHFLYHGKSNDGTELIDLVPEILLALSQKRLPSEVLPAYAGVAEDQFIQTVIDHLRSRPASTQYTIDKSEFSQKSEVSCLTNLEARKLLAGVLARKNPEKAFDHVRLALIDEPEDVDLNVLLSYLPDLDHKTSYERIREALELNPQHVDANVRMADLYSYNCLDVVSGECTQLRELAARHYRLALRQEPTRVDAAFGLGVSLLRTGRSGDAINYLRVAYNRLPWNARINLFLGEAYLDIGDRTSARQHLDRSALWEPEAAIRQRALNLLDTYATKKTTDS